MRLLLTSLCLMSLAAFASETQQVVYASDFASGRLDPAWSDQRLGITPEGARLFLGPFGVKESVQCRIDDLPAHQHLRIRIKLFVLYGSDGSSVYYGPDPWEIALVDGPLLLRTSFGNCGFFDVNNHQAFPGELPYANHPSWTASSEKNSLGFVKSWGDTTRGIDSVYSLELLIPHTKPSLALEFRSLFNETLPGEAWGLESVQVDAVSDLAPLSPAEQAAAIEELQDPKTSFAARWRLIADGDPSVQLLEQHLVPDPDALARIPALIQQLGDPVFRQRNAARKVLRLLGPVVLPSLHAALEGEEDPEVRFGLNELIKQLTLEAKTGPGRIIGEAADHILRVIDSPASRSLRGVVRPEPIPLHVQQDVLP